MFHRLEREDLRNSRGVYASCEKQGPQKLPDCFCKSPLMRWEHAIVNEQDRYLLYSPSIEKNPEAHITRNAKKQKGTGPSAPGSPLNLNPEPARHNEQPFT